MDKKKKKDASNPLGTVRRSIWFVLRAVLIVSLVLGVGYAVFTEGMYVSNMYIVTTEGMLLRADVILKNGSQNELTQYFTDDFLTSDTLLNSGTYVDFAVESFDYRYEIKGFKVFPWSKTGSITYIERIPSINASPVSDELVCPITPWVPRCYRINLIKVEGRWLINSLTVVEEYPEEDVLPTPDYSQLESGKQH